MCQDVGPGLWSSACLAWFNHVVLAPSASFWLGPIDRRGCLDGDTQKYANSRSTTSARGASDGYAMRTPPCSRSHLSNCQRCLPHVPERETGGQRRQIKYLLSSSSSLSMNRMTDCALYPPILTPRSLSPALCFASNEIVEIHGIGRRQRPTRSAYLVMGIIITGLPHTLTHTHVQRYHIYHILLSLSNFSFCFDFSFEMSNANGRSDRGQRRSQRGECAGRVCAPARWPVQPQPERGTSGSWASLNWAFMSLFV